MSDVDDALARANDVWNTRTSGTDSNQAFKDRRILAAEVRRLRNLVLAQQAAMDQFMARIQHALKELEDD